MSQIVFNLPDENTPGFLRRQRKALEFRELLGKDPTPEVIDSLADYLKAFVVKPEDDKAKIEALLDASKAQFNQLLNALAGIEKEDGKGGKKGPNPTK